VSSERQAMGGPGKKRGLRRNLPAVYFHGALQGGVKERERMDQRGLEGAGAKGRPLEDISLKGAKKCISVKKKYGGKKPNSF